MWIQPGATYNLRIQLPPASDRELAFRVILQQLPDKSEIQAGRIVFAVTQSLPAFAEPAQPTPALLRARLIDPRHLLISNEGGRRARLADIKADGQMVGMLNAVNGVGDLGSSILAGALWTFVSPQATFWTGAVLCLAAAVAVRVRIRM